MTHNVTFPPSITALRKVHSITSSARARTVGGMVSPSALAVLRARECKMAFSISFP
jgi:hypothetical protein